MRVSWCAYVCVRVYSIYVTFGVRGDLWSFEIGSWQGFPRCPTKLRKTGSTQGRLNVHLHLAAKVYFLMVPGSTRARPSAFAPVMLSAVTRSLIKSFGV